MKNQIHILGENTIQTKYNPDLAKQITQQIELQEEQAELEAKRKKDLKEKREEIRQNPITSIKNRGIPIKEGFIYVPSLKSYVGKELKFHGTNWYECHKQLQEVGQSMPILSQFVEFLRYLRANPQGIHDASSNEIKSILDDILTIRDPFRGEWLDAKFRIENNLSYIDFNNNITLNNFVPRNSEVLKDCLMESRDAIPDEASPGISLDSWLNNPTKQGLPKKNIETGVLYYSAPSIPGNTVATFCTNNWNNTLYTIWRPNMRNLTIGVRPVIHGLIKT